MAFFDYAGLVAKRPQTGRAERRCVLCARVHAHEAIGRCLSCQGALDVFYDLSATTLRASPNPLLRYFELLPITRPEDVLWLGEGNTPCFRAEGLGRQLQLPNLYLKNETANPTRTTKDRIASVSLSLLATLGVSEFVITSTGNSSTAYARAVQLLDGFRVHIFVGAHFLPQLQYPDHPRVHTYVVDGDLVATGESAKRFAARRGLLFEGGFFNLARREGLKLAYLEAFDQMPVGPAHVFQAVSSGMGLLGGYKGALEYHALGRLDRVPQFFAVQQESCAPMARAFEESCERILSHHIIGNPRGPATAILRGDPSQTYPYIRALATASGGRIVAVSLEAIANARASLLDCEGLHVCSASAAALAGAVQMANSGVIDRRSAILINLTGGVRPPRPSPAKVTHYTHDSCMESAAQ
jgi:threonine synthase